jgi:hypothetical protein
MTEPGTEAPSFHSVGAGGRMRIFDPPDERSTSGEAIDAGNRVGGDNRYAVLDQLAGLLDDQTVCFVGKGRRAIAALEAADKASAAFIRIILETPDGLTPADLGWVAQSSALQRSDILILAGSATSSDIETSARLLKSHLPRATLMFVYGAREDIERERPDLYAQAARDFLRRGSSFVIKD